MNVRAKPISEAALAVLSGMEVEGNIARIGGGQLDRKLYVEVNAALEAIGGKWNRGKKGHVFDGDPSEAIDGIIDAGGFIDRIKAVQFYPTPRDIARQVVEAAGVEPGIRVLEPSAGDGAIVRALPDGCLVVAVELNGRSHRAALEAVLCDHLKYGALYFDGDFLALAHDDPFLPAGGFDAVVMNPPFTRQQDIQHVEHAFRFLRPGGRLAAIMSAGVTYRQDRRSVAFREMVKANGGTIERLPEGSFKESGTGVHTVLVTMRRGA